MSARKALLGLLWFSLVIECAYPIIGFTAPAFMLTKFNVTVTPDTLFLGHVASWLLLFVAMACGLALKWVRAGDPAGITLSIALGVWWVGIGLALALKYGRMENLVLDAIKGAILVVAAVLTGRAQSPARGDSVA